jgi:hypothetical protein
MDRKKDKIKRRSGFERQRGFKRKLSRTGRRGFVKLLATTGVSAAALKEIPRDVGAASPKSEVSYIKSFRHTNQEAILRGEKPEREPVYGKWERDEWVRVKAAHNAKDNLLKMLRKKFRNQGGIGVGVRTSDRANDDSKQIVVTKDTVNPESTERSIQSQPNRPSLKQLREAVPSIVSGAASGDSKYSNQWVSEELPVLVEERESHLLDYDGCNSGFYDEDYTEIPGGSEFNGCTCATPAWSDNHGDWVMLTAGHCIGS